MNILIDTIRIAGFRGIKNVEMPLSRVTLLIGMNNSGKTSILKALQLALGDYSRYLSEEDFYISGDDKRADEIVIDTRIVPVDTQGSRISQFDENWQAEFVDKNIQSDTNGNQYVALRNRTKRNEVKGGFNTSRSTLERWEEFDKWRVEKIKETKISSRLESILFVFVDAQRDIHQEIREKHSLVSKVLSSIKYETSEIAALESLIKEVNDKAIVNSNELTSIQSNLGKLNQSFEFSSKSGKAEITPFPRRIRDLSKYFSAYFGETEENTFSMEYHGMGTRSWASMLIVKAFTELQSENHKDDVKQFFSIVAAEEPEAHLHPNAQRTLYRQLEESNGQIIISTHSPYLAAIAKQTELRYLKRDDNGISVKRINLDPESEESRKLHREVIHSRGEILFSKAIVLCEGETEEQALPLLFEKYFGSEPFVKGVSFVGVGGSGNKYSPFLKFAKDFDIPIFIFSDGEAKTVKELKKSYERVFGLTDITNCLNIVILKNTNFEGYLVSAGYAAIIESAICEVEGGNAIHEQIKKDGSLAGRVKTSLPKCVSCEQDIYQDVFRDYHSFGTYRNLLIDILKSNKTRYSPVIAEHLCNLSKEEMPWKIQELFKKIRYGTNI